MTSKRLQVLTTVQTLVANACVGFDVRGFVADAMKPERVPAGGMIIGDPGDPGEPEYEMSPLAYIYTHHIRVEILVPVAALPAGAAAAEAALDAAGAAIGAAVVANRTLSGLCQFLDVTALTVSSDDVNNTMPLRLGTFDIIAEYAVNTPLGD